MPDEKKFDPSNFADFLTTDTKSNCFEPMWIALFCLMLFGFAPTNSDSTESYLKGKIDAYENILKGFDFNER